MSRSPGVLSMQSLGLDTGLVVDLGNRLSITPVVAGYVIEHAVQHSFSGAGACALGAHNNQ